MSVEAKDWPSLRLRGVTDPVGFARGRTQIEAVVQRIGAQDGAKVERILQANRVAAGAPWRVAIAPHDDHAYAGDMYPLVLRDVGAPRVVIFGVA